MPAGDAEAEQPGAGERKDRDRRRRKPVKKTVDSAAQM